MKAPHKDKFNEALLWEAGERMHVRSLNFNIKFREVRCRSFVLAASSQFHRVFLSFVNAKKVRT